MCGIVGIVSKQKNGLYSVHGEHIKDMLIANSIRGLDSTGVFGIGCDNTSHMVKQAASPMVLLNSKEAKDLLDKVIQMRVVVGHNRKATTGEISSKNAHPFKEGHIMLVHNGAVYDHKSLHSEVDVDSHALCHSFAKDGAVETIQKVRGAFALVWYDFQQKALFLWRNKERPLAIMEKTQELYIASELEMLKWLAGRQYGFAMGSNPTFRELPENTLMKISFNPFQITMNELKEKVFVPTGFDTEAYRDLECERVADPANEDRIPPDWISKDEIAAVEKELNTSNFKEIGGLEPRHVTELYPFDSDIIFAWGESLAVKIYTDDPKRWEISGRTYMPGKPSFPALIYTESGMTLDTLRSWREAHTLIGKVSHILRKRDGTYIIHLKSVRVPHTFISFNKYRTFAVEWEAIVKQNKCVHCAKSLDINKVAESSVNPKGGTYGLYKVVCHECVKKNVPAEKYNALVPSNPAPL